MTGLSSLSVAIGTRAVPASHGLVRRCAVVGAILAAGALSGGIVIANVQASRLPAQEPLAQAAALVAPNVPKGRRHWRCDECGVIQAIRSDAVEGHAPTYEITIRLRTGSMLTLRESALGNWRVGDRIMLMKGGAAVL